MRRNKWKPIRLIVTGAAVGVALGSVSFAAASADSATPEHPTPVHQQTDPSTSFRSGKLTIHKDGVDEALVITSVPNFDVDKSDKTVKATLNALDGRTVWLDLKGDYKLWGMHLFVVGGTMKVSDGRTLDISGKTEINYDSITSLNHIWTADSVPTSGGKVDLDLNQADPVCPTTVRIANETNSDGPVSWYLRLGDDLLPSKQSVRRFSDPKPVTIPNFEVIGTIDPPPAQDKPLVVQDLGPFTRVTWGPDTYRVPVGKSVILLQDDEDGVQLTFSRTSGSDGQPNNELKLQPLG